MIPGMNPRQMKQAMKKLGIQQEEVEAIEVIIKCEDKDIIISNPQVTKVNMGGQKNFQISGEEHEVEKDSRPNINDDDIQTVMEQAEVSKEKAEKAITDANYDLAEAIIKLQG